MNHFIELLKKVNLTIKQKKTIYKIVIELPKKTDKAKERFIMFYNLDPGKDEKYTLTELSRLNGCQPFSIKSSLASIKRGLYHAKLSEMKTIQRIVGELEKNN